MKAALSENWAVYHYFSTFNVRHEMGVVELYDDSTARGLSLAEAVLSNSSKAVSSTNPIAIKTMRFVHANSSAVTAGAFHRPHGPAHTCVVTVTSCSCVGHCLQAVFLLQPRGEVHRRHPHCSGHLCQAAPDRDNRRPSLRS